jgi:hypothetical protein
MQQIPTPNKAGWMLFHNLIGVDRIFCPIANSNNIKGTPSMNMKMTYGIKNAPEEQYF